MKRSNNCIILTQRIPLWIHGPVYNGITVELGLCILVGTSTIYRRYDVHPSNQTPQLTTTRRDDFAAMEGGLPNMAALSTFRHHIA